MICVSKYVSCQAGKGQDSRECALILDRALRADGSEIRVMLKKWLRERFNLPSVEPKIVEMALSLEPRRVFKGFYEYDVKEDWHFRTLPGEPVLDHNMKTKVSIYNLEAEEKLGSAELWEASFPFENVNEWREVGLLVLAQVGWRPDCVYPGSVNLNRIVPPVVRGEGRFSLAV